MSDERSGLPVVRAGVIVHAWEESLEAESPADGATCRLVVRHSYTGDLDAAAVLRGVVAYESSESGGTDQGMLVGLERVRGDLAGKNGSLLFAVVARIAGGLLTGRWTVVDGSGTADWEGIAGSGHWVHDGELAFVFEATAL